MFKDISRVSLRDINVAGYFVETNTWRMTYQVAIIDFIGLAKGQCKYYYAFSRLHWSSQSLHCPDFKIKCYFTLFLVSRSSGPLGRTGWFYPRVSETQVPWNWIDWLIGRKLFLSRHKYGHLGPADCTHYLTRYLWYSFNDWRTAYMVSFSTYFLTQTCLCNASQ